jgi:hypothetical protein
LLAENKELVGFRSGDFTTTRDVFPKKQVAPIKYLRSNTWRFADYDRDGAEDLLVGHDSWDNFGWFDTNDWYRRYSASGKWTGGAPEGRVYWLRNSGTPAEPRYLDAQPVLAAEAPAATYGAPTPNLADFDGDGDLDLLCGSFLDHFTYFQNIGTRTEPRYAAGVRLPVTMDLQMIVPTAVDWDGDGDFDLICGDEDGRVALIENSGTVERGIPKFLPPHYFQQEADELDAGVLVTPVGFDWDGDGDEDIVCGQSAGYLMWFENLSGAKVDAPKWSAPRKLKADGKIIRIMAGGNGSIQGPAEAKCGYTTISVAVWDEDGLPDIIANSIWGRVVWFRNIGTRTSPKLTSERPVEVAWTGAPPKPEWYWWNPGPGELATAWRTTPAVVDFDRDGRQDLIMQDHEGWLAFYARRADGALDPGRRALCDSMGAPIRVNAGAGGRSGRRKLCVTDWDGDGRLDLLLNGKNAEFWRGLGQQEGKWLFRKEGDVSTRNIEGHDTSPTTVDWDGDGVRDLLIGAEDGKLYYLRNPRKP